MPKKFMLSCLATAAIACAQYTPPPPSYTLVQQNSLFGPATTTSVYRNGSKAVIDIVQPGTHVRTVYDLQSHTNISWDVSQAAAECGNGTFTGDWGDPFVGSAGILDELNKQHPTPIGTETVNGVSAGSRSSSWTAPRANPRFGSTRNTA